MNTNIATTIEQSKCLIAAGLDPESADMCYKTFDVEDSESDDELVFDFITRPYSEYLKYVGPLGLSYRACPAWSLSALWQMVYELDKTYEFPTNLSANELIDTLVATIINRRGY